MVRALVAVFACVAFAALVGSDGSVSTRDILVRDAATILPAGTRVVEGDYRRQCMSVLVSIPSPPCLSVRFRLPGTAADRTRAIQTRASGRWNVTRHAFYDNFALQFRRGDVRAQAYVLRTCPSQSTNCDSDYLRVDLRPMPRLQFRG